MKNILILFLFLAIFSGIKAQVTENDLNCSTIIIGRNASATGFVMVAHNEDDGGNQIVNFYKWPLKDWDRNSTLKLKEGAVIPQASHTLSYLWMEMPGQDYADSYMNENGVLITSNSCPSKEQFGEIVDGGIGYELRKILAERALSARVGVELAGQIVEQIGYSASGRTYTIADKNEAWLFAVVRGKQWVAQRVPDDQVAFIPNYYTIKEIDLSDNENFLASKDLINYAQRRGWYNPDTDGKFNFAKVYSSERNLSSMANIGRMWIGVQMLSGKKFKVEDDFPFSIIPSKKFALKDLFPILENHYEGTQLDDSQEYKKGSPHSNKTMSICSSTQQLSFIAELRTGMPWDIGGRIWVAPKRGCVNAYLPIYFGVTEFPSTLTMDSPDVAFKMHFKRPDSIYDRNQPMSWWSFVSVAEYTDADYLKRISSRKKSKEELQQYFLKLAAQVEKEYLPIYKKQPAKAAALINSFEQEVLAKTIADNNKFLGK